MTATKLERNPFLSCKQSEPKNSMLDTIQKTLDAAVADDSASGVHRVSREIFTDPELFELEMKHIFEGNWIYLAHESQIPNKNDYFTTYMGRQPIFVARNKDNDINAFINACSHRGSMICRHKRGNKATFTCPFHGWTFSNSGRLLKVKDPDGAGYPDRFNKEGSHDLTKIARFESYRGFLFGSLNPDVKSLAEHLGETTKIIDMMVDQAPDGLEVLRGSSSYIYDGNWKLQAENGADGRGDQTSTSFIPTLRVCRRGGQNPPAYSPKPDGGFVIRRRCARGPKASCSLWLDPSEKSKLALFR
jgi:benzoate/toluate 1,2-dioxygenase subunit alpha